MRILTGFTSICGTILLFSSKVADVEFIWKENKSNSNKRDSEK